MPNYLKPLRRKIGVITLVVASVFTAGWVRSQIVFDTVVFPDNVYSVGTSVAITHNSVSSAQRSLLWTRIHEETDGVPTMNSLDGRVRSEYPEWSTSFSHDPEILYNVIERRRCLFGFAFDGSHSRLQNYEVWKRFVLVPYWSVVIPITALSAWLLLSKPRRTKPQPDLHT